MQLWLGAPGPLPPKGRLGASSKVWGREASLLPNGGSAPSSPKPRPGLCLEVAPGSARRPASQPP